ncbi:hypothetical protein [Corynebacterium sphenisci]|uniref:hypothetical protein n=1 Tax=Corynebacterium sphenisci TaxID=191493 RepID=UPI0009515B95|nr:hypothetical protein [Corynebacterium sphenisci]
MADQDPAGYGPDGIDGAGVGRNLGLAALVLGIGGLLTSPFLIGAGFAAVAIILGVVAILRARGARRRVLAAGRAPRTAGAQGLAGIGIATGVLAIVVVIVLFQAGSALAERCAGLEDDPMAYRECLEQNSPLGD